jgi:bla regulator protein BlaR1
VPEDFEPGVRRFGGDLYLKGLTFRAKGWMTGHMWSWTKGAVLDDADKTASRYTIKEIGGEKYMFLEWKSGDYVIRHQKPEYYVLKKK